MNNEKQLDRLVVADGSMRLLANVEAKNASSLMMAPHIRVHYSKSDFSNCGNFKNYSPFPSSSVESAPPSTRRPFLTVTYSQDGAYASSSSSSYRYSRKNRTNFINQKRTFDKNVPTQSFYDEHSPTGRPDLYGNGNYYRYSVSSPSKNAAHYSSSTIQNRQYNNTEPFENRYHSARDKNIIDNVPLETAVVEPAAVELTNTKQRHYKADKSPSQLAYFQNRSDCSISVPLGQVDRSSSFGETTLPNRTTTCNQKRTFYRHSTVMMRTKNVPQNHKQLSVPEIRVRSLSTPSSPDTAHDDNRNEQQNRRYNRAIVKNLNTSVNKEDDDDDNHLLETFQGARRGDEKVFFPLTTNGGGGGRRVARYSMDNAAVSMDNAASKMNLEKMKSRSATSSTVRLGSSSPAFRRRLPLTPDQNPIEFVVSPPPSISDLTPSEQPPLVAPTPRTSYLMVVNPDTRQRSNSLQMTGEVSFGKVALESGVSGALALPGQMAPLRRRGTGRKLPQAPSVISTNNGQATTDEPKIPIRKESHQSDCPLFTFSATGKMCHRRTSEQSMEQYIATTCTCSSLSDDKSEDYKSVSPGSSSDTEDQTGISSYGSLASVKKPSLQNDSGFSSDAVVDQLNINPTAAAVPLTPVEKRIIDEYRPAGDDKDHGLGTLYFTGQYFPVRKRLRINVHKAENLAGQLRPEMELNTFVKMYLDPGKLHKQNGCRLVKNSRNAVYNEELFFDNLSETEIQNLSLVIKVCHMVKKQFQKKDIAVGAVVEPLAPLLTSKKEVKFVRHLKPKHIKNNSKLIQELIYYAPYDY
uniref:C2 domain-containing protein n=1 Tax=Romanomermis culicivorax TaxID=13658 RepID=A0A915KBZ5_ROMCU